MLRIDWFWLECPKMSQHANGSIPVRQVLWRWPSLMFYAGTMLYIIFSCMVLWTLPVIWQNPYSALWISTADIAKATCAKWTPRPRDRDILSLAHKAGHQMGGWHRRGCTAFAETWSYLWDILLDVSHPCPGQTLINHSMLSHSTKQPQISSQASILGFYANWME